MNREDLENILEYSHSIEDAIERILSLFKESEYLSVGDTFILNKEMYKCTLKHEYTVESVFYTKDIVLYQFKNDNDQLSFIYHTEFL